MRVLVVGCGYVGLPVATELARRGHEVFGLRRTPLADTEPLQAHGVTLLHADVTRPEELERLPGPFDRVVNTVSSSHGGVEAYRAVYLEGTRNLVNWLRRMPVQRFVYTSSTGVYGQEDGSWVDEASPTEPESPTSQVLVETEQVLLQTARATGFPAVILRVAGIYGPGRGFFLQQYLKGEARLADGGQRLANMIHRDDVVGCILAALEHGQPGDVYNAADDEPVTHLDLFQWLSARLGRPMPPVLSETAPVPRKRAATNKRVSNRKLKSDLRYRFRYPTFREGYAAVLEALERTGRA